MCIFGLNFLHQPKAHLLCQALEKDLYRTVLRLVKAYHQLQKDQVHMIPTYKKWMNLRRYWMS